MKDQKEIVLFNEIVQELKKLLKRYYNKTWIVTYSGGKDSTLVLHLVSYIISKHRIFPKKLIILYNDTLSEIPIIRVFSLHLINKFIKYLRNEVGYSSVSLKIIKPELTDTFYWRVIVRGYPAPNFKFRWCSYLLKIYPTLKASLPQGIYFVGSRIEESSKRSKKLKNNILNKICILNADNLIKIFPICSFSVKDVLDTLSSINTPWGGDEYKILISLYGFSNKEIGENIDEGVIPRFGCWFCTVVNSHRGLETIVNYLPRNSLTNPLIQGSKDSISGLIMLSIARELYKYVSNIKIFRDKKILSKGSVSKYLGPLNTIGRSIILESWKIIYEKNKELLYGLNMPLKKYGFSISLADLFFYVDTNNANYIIKKLDSSNRFYSIDAIRDLDRNLTYLKTKYKYIYTKISKYLLELHNLYNTLE